MALQTRTFAEIVSRIAVAMQGAAPALLDFAVGSPLRAVAESTAGVVLWLQAIILQVLTLTRASTSAGADLDSWVADYGLDRLPASASTGLVTFSRFTPTQQALIPAGAGVQTSDGTRDFTVSVDPANPAWDAAQDGYVLAAGVAGIGLPVAATVPGAGGNIQSGTLSVITTPIPGVDTATNASAFINGIDAESDAALRARFVLYLASLSKATKAAVGYAVTSTRQGLAYTITENEDFDGTPDIGFFYVVVDDFSGYPDGDLLAGVYAAVDAVRPLGSRFAVYPPAVLTANISMTLTTAAGFDHGAVVAAVDAVIEDFVNGIPLGTGLPYTRIAGVVYSVPGVTNASSILLNGGTADLAADQTQKVLAGTVVIA